MGELLAEELKKELVDFGEEVEEQDLKERKKKSKRVRICWFACRRQNDEGKVLITEEKILSALMSHKTIESYAYILHNKDTVTSYDLEADDDGQYDDCKVGDAKPAHFHVVMQLSSPMSITSISSWFGIPEHLICFNKTRGKRDSFLDMVAYFTHEFEIVEKEKYVYPRTEVAVGGLRADTIWKDVDFIYKKREQHRRYKVSTDLINDLIEEVANNGMLLEDAKEELGSAVYLRNEKYFKLARSKYVNEKMPMPGLRTVFYIDSEGGSNKSFGKGGRGKTVCTHALAKQFAREFGANPTDSYDELIRRHIVYEIGDKNVAVQRYDGEPIMILNEMDAYEMINVFGRKGTKELLDSFPSRREVNIKYGSTVILAKYIIINGIERYDTFIKGLAGIYGDRAEEDHDLSQYYRRFFSHITIVNERYMNMFFTKGLLDGTEEYREYYAIEHVYAPFRESLLNYQSDVVNMIADKTYKPVIDKAKEYEEKMIGKNKLGIDSPEAKELLRKIDENQASLIVRDTSEEHSYQKPRNWTPATPETQKMIEEVFGKPEDEKK